MRVLVLGATGLVGSAALRVLAEAPGVDAVGAVRDEADRALFAPRLRGRLALAGDLSTIDALEDVLQRIAPDVVINCVGARRTSNPDPERLLALFAVLPRRLAHLCAARGVRLVQIGTDGVFSGRRGGYRETDLPDATDPYGLAKMLGEATAAPALTLRTSFVGPEPRGGAGLLGWTLSQTGRCRGFVKAIFSGLTSDEFARVLRDRVLPRPDLTGLYHVASAPISKYALVREIARAYGLDLHVEPVDGPAVDRSLDGSRFARATGYAPPPWPAMIERMRDFSTEGV